MYTILVKIQQRPSLQDARVLYPHANSTEYSHWACPLIKDTITWVEFVDGITKDTLSGTCCSLG